jgi:V/A-type H+-transporting ATPase subunit E
MAEPELPSSGVQALITRLREEGIAAGRREAEQILAAARAQAERLVADAQAESRALRDGAAESARREHDAARAALELAVRDALIGVREKLERGVAGRLRELVGRALARPDVHEQIVVAAVRAGLEERGAAAPRAAVLTAGADFAPDRLDALIAELTRELLTGGVELLEARHGQDGVRVRLTGATFDIEISEAAVTGLLAERLLPRFRELLDRRDGRD